MDVSIAILGLFIVLGIALLLCCLRLAAGPTLPDRVVALDMVGLLFAAISATAAMYYNLSTLLDIGIAFALVAFLGSVAIARHLEKTV